MTDMKISLNIFLSGLLFFAVPLFSGQIQADNRVFPPQIDAGRDEEKFSIVSDTEVKIFKKSCVSLSSAVTVDEVFETEFHYIFRDTSVCEVRGTHRLCRTFVVKKHSTFCTEIRKLNGTLWGTPYVVAESVLDLTESSRGNSDIANLLASPRRSRVAIVGYSEVGEVLVLESRDVIIFAPTGE
jgi:hypothetical protein